jgi:hypothetical protein
MTQISLLAQHSVFRCAYLGAVGGYVFGMVDGLLTGQGFSRAASLGGHTLLAGATAGAAGLAIYRISCATGAFRKPLSMGVVGALFFGIGGLLIDASPAVQSTAFRGSAIDFVAGFLGGIVGGWLLNMMTKPARS